MDTIRAVEAGAELMTCPKNWEISDRADQKTFRDWITQDIAVGPQNARGRKIEM
jgi:hypothetical protein